MVASNREVTLRYRKKKTPRQRPYIILAGVPLAELPFRAGWAAEAETRTADPPGRPDNDGRSNDPTTNNSDETSQPWGLG